MKVRYYGRLDIDKGIYFQQEITIDELTLQTLKSAFKLKELEFPKVRTSGVYHLKKQELFEIKKCLSLEKLNVFVNTYLKVV